MGGGGVDLAIKIGVSAGGAGGGGGIDPVSCLWCSTTVTGSSMTFVAETFIPFLSPHASVFWPSMLKFLVFGDCELLVCAVFQSKNHSAWWIHVPDFAGNGLHGCDDFRCRLYGESSL